MKSRASTGCLLVSGPGHQAQASGDKLLVSALVVLQLNIPFPAILFSLFSIRLPSSRTTLKYLEQKPATGNIYNEANAHRSDGFD